MGRKKTQFFDAATMNNRTFNMYYYRLLELSMDMFEWKNLPETCDARFLELALNSDGMAIFFYDEVLGFLTLQTMIGGNLNVYRIPKIRTAYAVNGYQNRLDETNSVIIFNNYLHMPSINDLELYARRLYEIERAIDVNVKAQKTPHFIRCSENQRLVLHNLFMKYDGNEPAIFGDKDLDFSNFNVFPIEAPFVAADLQMLKRQLWGEALTYIGITNVNTEKKERQITDEVVSGMGAVEASRFSKLNARRDAAKQINEMFGLNIEVYFRNGETTERASLEEGEADGALYNGTQNLLGDSSGKDVAW